MKSEQARSFYEADAQRGGGSARQLDRQIQSQFDERTSLSRDKAAMLKKGARVRPDDVVTPEDGASGDLKLGRFTHADAGQMHNLDRVTQWARSTWSAWSSCHDLARQWIDCARTETRRGNGGKGSS